MKNKKFLIGGIALAAIVVVILWLTVFGKSTKTEQALYKTDAVSRGDIEALVVASGTLNPVDAIDVGTQVSGRISKIYVDFNSKVKAGQLVAELDQATYVTRLEQNKANYKTAVAALDRAHVTADNSKRKYDRALSLFEKNLISYEEKDAAETDYLGAKADVNSAAARVDQAKSQVDSSQVDLNYCIIRSPIDGVVISRNINVGQTVASQFTAPVLFKVANDLTKMQVESSIDEADIGRVKEGQKVRFSVDAYSTETFLGDVTQVRYSPTVTSGVVTYTAIVTVSNPELKLRPGMTATASIITGQAKNALKVSNTALRFTPNLSAEEMQKIMKATFESMRAKLGGTAQGQAKQGDGGQGQPAAAASQGQTRAASGSQTQSGAGNGTAGQGSPQAKQGGRRQMSRVWVQDEKGQLKPIFLRLGVSDNNSTEVLWGDLKEGMLVITGTNGNQQQGFPSPMRMLTGR